MYVDQEFDYYYGEQIKNYIAQFAQVFSEMYVTVGKNDSGSESKYIRIPIVYGSPDKVVAAIKAENTQNTMVRVPMFSIKLDGISLMMDRKSGTNTEHRKTVLPVGGDIKTDLKVIKRLKPLPYNLTFSVTAYTSNSNQMFQIIERILILFDPLLQFQTSDVYGDWTKIVDAELMSVNLDDNRSPDNDGRILQTTFGFDVRAYMAPPADIKKNAITSIRLRIDAISGTANTQEVATDVDRPLPPHAIIYDIDDAPIPPN